jgi:hypothetical protein
MPNQPRNYDSFVNSRFLFDVVLSILRIEMFGKDLVFIIIIYLSKNLKSYLLCKLLDILKN